jgi:hypothetical protein
MGYRVVVDDNFLGQVLPRGNELQVLVGDRTLLPEGGTISVSGPEALGGWKVPEKLHFTAR